MRHVWPVAPNIRVIPQLAEARRLALAHNVVPVTHSFVSDLETPVSAFLKLGAPRRGFLLESAEQGQHLGRYSFLGVGARTVVQFTRGRLTVRENGDRLEVESDDPFVAVADLVKSYRPPAISGLPPLAGGPVGYFGYDLVRHRRAAAVGDRPDVLGLPDMALLLTDTVLVFDHLQHTITMVANAFAEGRTSTRPYDDALEPIAAVRRALDGPVPRAGRRACAAAAHHRPAARVTSNMRREQFEACVARIVEYIHAGDAFQVVPSQRWSAPSRRRAVLRLPRAARRQPVALHVLPGLRRLRRSPAPARAADDRQRPARVDHRPIAGTRPRGADAAEDARLADELLRRREGARRARHARRPRAQRPRPRLRVRDGARSTRSWRSSATRTSCTSSPRSPGDAARRTSAPMRRAARDPAPPARCRGAPKVRAMQIIDELEPGQARRLRRRDRLPELRRRPRHLHPHPHGRRQGRRRARAGGRRASSPTREPAYEYEESLNKAARCARHRLAREELAAREAAELGSWS